MGFSLLNLHEKEKRNFMYDPGRARLWSGLLFAVARDK